MKVGLVGAGKRMSNVFVPLLKTLGHDIVGFVTRTQATATAFEAMTGVKQKQSLGELYKENPDYIIVCVSPNAISTCTRRLLGSGIPILIETPIEDFTLLEAVETAKATVGVLEQWPYLPLEQFKSIVYEKKLISRPFLVKNDCRSYDYHALAQLRTYIGRQDTNGRSILPLRVKGTQVITPLAGFKNADGTMKNVTDAWDLATIELDNGAVLVHEFSYACKVAPFRSIQSLRAYSTDGTIVTGRIFDRDDDCEIIDVEYLKDGQPTRLGVNVVRDNLNTIVAISSDLFSWHRDFDGATTDADTAIAAHLLHMKNVVQEGKEPLYNLKDATMDQYLVLAIKQACRQGLTLNLESA